MGEMVEFPSNGHTANGYLAVPDRPGPGVVVIQEWWGLVDHIKDVSDRFAAQGFVTLAPDLYHGKTTREPDEADKLLMSMQMDQAARDMSGAYDFIAGHPMTEPKKVSVVGFCAGAGLALRLGALHPLDAVVAFYPAFAHGEPDYSNLKGAVLLHGAELDDWTTPEKIEEVGRRLRSLGRPVEWHIYPGTEHAFFNDARPEVHAPEASATAWQRTLDWIKTQAS